MSACAVLVVDDEAAMRTALEASFRRNGWNVTTASGAGEALAKFRRMPCPLVVTDVRMPDGDGLQVMQGVREMAPETAVIFLTAYGTVTDAVQAIKEGACDYLMKPVSFDRLREAAERVLAIAGVSGKEKQRNASAPELIGRSPVFPSASRSGAPGGADRRRRIDRSGKRHRQGTGRATDSPRERAPRRAVRGRELLGLSGSSAGKRTVRPRSRRLHRCELGQAGKIRTGQAAARSCSTKWAKCRSSFSRNSCACCRSAKWIRWAAHGPCRSMCA